MECLFFIKIQGRLSKLKELYLLLSELEEEGIITKEELFEQMDNYSILNRETQTLWGSYRGKHYIMITDTIRELLNVGYSSEQSLNYEYSGLEYYLGDLTKDNPSVTQLEQVMDNRRLLHHFFLSSSIDNNYDEIEIPALSREIVSAVRLIDTEEVFSAGKYFSLYNSIKKLREEQLDDFFW